MDGLNSLRDFIDLGGVFILALLLVYGWFKVLRGIDNKLSKVLVLLSVLIKQSTNFNDVEEVLGDEVVSVEKTLGSSLDKV